MDEIFFHKEQIIKLLPNEYILVINSQEFYIAQKYLFPRSISTQIHPKNCLTLSRTLSRTVAASIGGKRWWRWYLLERPGILGLVPEGQREWGRDTGRRKQQRRRWLWYHPSYEFSTAIRQHRARSDRWERRQCGRCWLFRRAGGRSRKLQRG